MDWQPVTNYLARPVIEVAGLEFDGYAFGYAVTSLTGAFAVLESSPDLASWVPLQTNALAGGRAHLTDPTAGTFLRRFYRVQIQPAR